MVKNDLSGRSIIAGESGRENSNTFRALDPRSGEPTEPVFFSADLEELKRAVTLASEARIEFGKLPGKQKAILLRQIANNIESLGEALIHRASLESGLPNARLFSERGRTCFQLRLFAELVEEGSWVDARIDLPDTNRLPLPKPDVRSMLIPVGPVAVFCASNFPLAFSVAGGDTASALAAGCPVIVNAHPAHPGTAELVGHSIAEAVRTSELPEGVFSLLFSNDYQIGQALVGHPEIRAVGFTGSRLGGRALMDIAAARPEPIPVFAEMSSINPTFILPSVLAERTDEMAKGLHASFTMGVGQFCTKPGLVVLPQSSHLTEFTEKLSLLTKDTAIGPLLTPQSKANYEKALDKRDKTLLLRSGEHELKGLCVNATLFQISAEGFLRTPELSDEIFGPTTLLVTSGTRHQLLEIARSMEGQLTAAIFGTVDDLRNFSDLISILETKVGRLIFNAFPTGVEVGHAMVHGGTYPATSDSRSTSVGTRAINRFSRLACYQGFPQEALPDELKDNNPNGIWRLVDGEFTKRTC
jgi:alpha-ketoglutaric semialdehyde dehydrogenase